MTVNAQRFDFPLYVTRVGTLKGFAFVTHGADDNTSVSIAASRADREYIPTSKIYLPPPSRVPTANGYTQYPTTQKVVRNW